MLIDDGVVIHQTTAESSSQGLNATGVANGLGIRVTLVNLSVSSKIRDDRKLSSATLNLTSEWLFSCMAVHVSLEGRWSSEPLIANFALVLLGSVRLNSAIELSHHGSLASLMGEHLAMDQAHWSRQIWTSSVVHVRGDVGSSGIHGP